MDKSTGTHPSLEDKRALPNCGNKDGNIIHVFEMTVPMCNWCLVIKNVAHDLYLKSHQRCSAGIRPVKFFHTDSIIISLLFLSYTQRHCHVRIERVQTVAIELEAHNSLEYHSMIKH